MQLQDLGTFVTVATERSFSVAAKKLHRTQPAVSQAIRRLEEELGDRLFDRSVRNGALTEAGRLLLEYAARLLTLAADAEVAVRELQQVRRGRVIIGANEAAVHSLLPLPRPLRQSPSTGPCRGAPCALPRHRRGHPQPQPRFRRADVPAGRSRPPVAGARRRRAGDARASQAILSPAGAAPRSRKWGSRPSSPTTIRRRRASAFCAPTNAGTPRSTFRSRFRASTGSSVRSRWASEWPCCRGGARSTRSRTGSSWRSRCPG